jgi:3-deoxy-manno-octulosonate cytidylyltransferase (CMP-KDO synthetase)
MNQVGASVAIIIPARLGSTRFPNKPLAPILGVPMIELVYRHAAETPHVELVAVATCDVEIAELIRSIGGLAVMTSTSHQRATDRTAEAILHLELERGAPFDIVVMLQGDEPVISSGQLTQVVDAMTADPQILVANLVGEILSDAEFLDPNCIKVVSDLHDNALYFSRLPIPHGAERSSTAVGKQVCAIGFRRDFLLEYLAMAPTALEEAESIDMLRILQNGQGVRLIRTNRRTQAVDCPDDVPIVESLLAQ